MSYDAKKVNNIVTAKRVKKFVNDSAVSVADI